MPEAADGGTELLALDAADGPVWAVGGGAASGTEVSDARRRRRRRARRWRPTRPAARFGLTFDPADFGPADRFEDVAAVPGTNTAWAALVPYAERGRTNAKAEVALLNADTGAASIRRSRPRARAAARPPGSLSPARIRAGS